MEFDHTLATRSSYTTLHEVTFLAVRVRQAKMECANHSVTRFQLPGFKKPVVAHQGLPAVLKWRNLEQRASHPQPEAQRFTCPNPGVGKLTHAMTFSNTELHSQPKEIF